MPPERPLSYNATLVLEAISQGRGHGFEMMQFTGLASGTIYPILRRLEAAGSVRSNWEDETKAHSEGRPARRYYSVTNEGAQRLTASKAVLAARQATVFGNLLSDEPKGQ